MKTPAYRYSGNELNRFVIDTFKQMGGHAWRVNSGAFSPNGKRFIRFGEKGACDTMAISAGRFFAVETKGYGDEPTPEQWWYIDNMNRCGAYAFFMRSTDDLVDVLEAKDEAQRRKVVDALLKRERDRAEAKQLRKRSRTIKESTHVQRQPE